MVRKPVGPFNLLLWGGKVMFKRLCQPVCFSVRLFWLVLQPVVVLSPVSIPNADGCPLIISRPSYQVVSFVTRGLCNRGYFIANLAGYYTVANNWGYVKRLQLMARANNLFDKNYTEVFGYSSPRFNIIGGLRLEI